MADGTCASMASGSYMVIQCSNVGGPQPFEVSNQDWIGATLGAENSHPAYGWQQSCSMVAQERLCPLSVARKPLGKTAVGGNMRSAVGDLANCGCGVVGSMQPCCNRCGAMYYVRCDSGNTLSVCASSASAAETIGRANCQGSSIASVTDSQLFQKRRIPPLGPKATMRSATGGGKTKVATAVNWLSPLI